jgi:hypothetical protein
MVCSFALWDFFLCNTQYFYASMSATIEEDENANELQFGNIDFEETETLTNDEVYLLLLRRQNAGVTNE